METHVDEGTPLSNYLEGTGEREEPEWQEPESNPDYDVSPPSTPPRDFAPRGLPKVRRRFRDNLPTPLQLDTLNLRPNLNLDVQNHASPFLEVLRLAAEAVSSSIGHVPSAAFLERLRLEIVQSQLLDNPLVAGLPPPAGPSSASPIENDQSPRGITTSGAVAAIVFGFGTATLVRWFRIGGIFPTWKRLCSSLVILAVVGVVARAYVRREIMKSIQSRGIAEASKFITLSKEFDGVNSAALNFIMEVELVSRGYRLSTPIPPISRLEHNGQNVKCLKLRNTLRTSLAEAISKYYQVAFAIWGIAEQTELLQLQSQYQFTVADVVERFQHFSKDGLQDGEKLQSLKDSAFLLHDIRKVFLSGLLALHTAGNKADRVRFTAVSEAFRELNVVTRHAYSQVRNILTENDLAIPKTPKGPQTPNHDRWHGQLRRLNSMTMNIRSVQAKLHLLREESSLALNEADDISDLGPLFMAQYDSIGQDLDALMEAWRSGKSSLASGIDRNEKRLSSMTTVLMSPASSISGQTIAEEGEDSEEGVDEALRKLNGEVSPSPAAKSSTEPEVFEAISVQRPRSMLSREERLAKMREDRRSKELVKVKADAHRGMMRELQGVLLNQKPSRTRISL